MVSRPKGLFGIVGLAVSRQPYNLVKGILYVPYIQFEGIKYEEIHRDDVSASNLRVTDSLLKSKAFLGN